MKVLKAEKQRGGPKVMNKVAKIFFVWFLFFLYSYFTVKVHSVM